MRGWVLAEATGLISTGLPPAVYMRSATFVVTAFLGLYFFYLLARGSLWERLLFAPITLAGAALAGWLTFG